MNIRILSYNIHKCIGGIDRRYRPERIRDVIASYEPDIVMLQEVDNAAKRSNSDKQVDLLGDLLQMRHRCYFPNVRVRGGGEYGNAILSRYAFTMAQNIDLTIRRKKRRSVLHARFRVRLRTSRRSRTLHAYNMHLGLSGIERKLQLRRFFDSHPFKGLYAPKSQPYLTYAPNRDYSCIPMRVRRVCDGGDLGAPVRCWMLR